MSAVKSIACESNLMIRIKKSFVGGSSIDKESVENIDILLDDTHINSFEE